jgi:hypothetical protein
MAFDLNKLVLTTQHGVPDAPKNWIYTTADALAAVNTAAYFNSASRHLKVNDTMDVVSSTGGTSVHSRVIVNAVVFDGEVDISDGAVLAATDTD